MNNFLNIPNVFICGLDSSSVRARWLGRIYLGTGRFTPLFICRLHDVFVFTWERDGSTWELDGSWLPQLLHLHWFPHARLSLMHLHRFVRQPDVQPQPLGLSASIAKLRAKGGGGCLKTSVSRDLR